MTTGIVTRDQDSGPGLVPGTGRACQFHCTLAIRSLYISYYKVQGTWSRGTMFHTGTCTLFPICLLQTLAEFLVWLIRNGWHIGGQGQSHGA